MIQIPDGVYTVFFTVDGQGRLFPVFVQGDQAGILLTVDQLPSGQQTPATWIPLDRELLQLPLPHAWQNYNYIGPVDFEKKVGFRQTRSDADHE